MPSKLSARNKWLISAVTALLLYTVFGFFLLPGIVKNQAVKRISELLDREVSIEKVEMNPFTFSMSVQNLRIVDLDGQDLATWDLVYGNFDPLTSILKLQWHLGEARVVNPKKHFRIDESGKLNVADLVEKFAREEEGGEPSEGLPSVGIGTLSVEEWAVEFDDLSYNTPFHTVIGPMNFGATDFTTKPDENSPYTFAGTTNSGENFSWSGTISISPLGSKGRIDFSNISIPKYIPFVEHLINGSIGSGKVAFATDYEIALADQITAKIENATASLDTVEVTLAGSPEPLAFLQHLNVAITSADLMARVADVEEVTVDGFTAHVERRADGTIDALDLLIPPDETAAESDGTTGLGPAPSVRIARISVANGNTSVVDRTTREPVELLVDGISATITNAGTDLDREVGLEAKFTVNNTGTIAMTGRARPRPFAIQIDVTGDGLALTPFDAYVADVANVRIADGSVKFAGKIEAEQSPDGGLSARWSGSESVLDLSVVDTTSDTELLSWAALSANDTALSIWPVDFSAGEIALTDPALNVVVAGDRTINVFNALGISLEPESPEGDLAENAAPATDQTQSGEEAESLLNSLSARIDTITISGGSATATDQSTQPEFSAQLHDFSGSIRGLSSENLARADVDLSGQINTSGRIKISGSINPLAEDRFSNVSIAVNDIGLPRFSPYSGRYIGQTIESGTLEVGVKYKISQNVIEGENTLFMDQFYLGEKVESDESLGLPVGLAVALLRDRHGQIKLPPLEVRGSLDDPDFKYGRVLAHAIGTLIGKMAAAPFSMLGGLFGGGKDQDISYVDFRPGDSTVTEAGLEKLQVLANALFERPSLRLQIIAPPAADIDRPSVAESKLLDLLREEQALMGTPAETSSAATNPAETDALILSAYARRFPAPEANQSSGQIHSSSQPAATPKSESEEDPGLIKRVFTSLFGSADGNKENASSPAEAKPGEPSTEAAAGQPSTTPPAPTVAEMRAKLLDSIEVTVDEFAALANSRAIAVEEQLLTMAEIEPDRISVATDPTPPDGAASPGDAARVFFGLQ